MCQSLPIRTTAKGIQGRKGIHKKRLGMIIGILIFTGAFVPCLAGSSDLKIAFVDIQKAVNECDAGKEARTTLAKKAERFQNLIAQKRKELEETKETIEKQWPMLNQETQAIKEQEFQAKLRDFQRWGEDSQNELDQKKKEMERNVTIGLMKVIQEVGANEGYMLILEKNEYIVMFSSPATDITDRVIKAYDAQKK